MVSELERTAAVEAVATAARLCAGAQGRLVAGDTLTKGDESPVTVADFAAQAVVCATLVERLGGFDMVGEEDASDLADPARSGLLDGVTGLVDRVRPGATSPSQVVDWVGLGGADGTSGRYWTLDPIDGTKGFLRGDQYAIALALIEAGEVVLGVLGCPNLPNPDGTRGAIFLADESGARAWFGGHDRDTDPVPVSVAAPASLAEARFCESVESGHSNHDHAARIAARLGITAEPYRIDSQCKYGAVSRGDASIYLRLPTRADYLEKIWDHAAGKFVVERAGGRVTDVTGAALDFSHGRTLAANSGVVATDGRFHDEVVAAVEAVLAAG